MHTYRIDYLFHDTMWTSNKDKPGSTTIESYNLLKAAEAFDNTHQSALGWYEMTKVELVEV